MKKIIYKFWKILPSFIKTFLQQILIKNKFPNVTFGKNLELAIFSILNKELIFGDGSYIGKNCSFFSLAGSFIHIGKYTSIAQDCFFITYNHKMGYLNLNNIPGILLEERRFSKSITIGNNVWIGTKSVVLPGVSIGDGAIIGAGSIVTKDVPAYTVFAGNPAKFIKNRFTPDIVQELSHIDWTNWDIKKIQKNINLFNINIDTHTINSLHVK